MQVIEGSVRHRILNTALETFLESGYRKVSMDEIAYRLGMSKKTIYAHVPGKRELLRQALLEKVRRIGEGLEMIVEDQEQDVVSRLHQLMVYLGEALPRPGRSFLEDMQRGLSDLWQEIDATRIHLIRRNFLKLFEKAAEQGAITAKFDAGVLVLVVSLVLQHAVQPEVLARIPYSAGQLASSIVDLLLVGLLSDEGRIRYLNRSSTRQGDPEKEWSGGSDGRIQAGNGK